MRIARGRGRFIGAGVTASLMIAWALAVAGPASAAPATWQLVPVKGTDFLGSACDPGGDLCAASGSEGTIFTSANPLGGASQWHGAKIDEASELIYAIACPSASLCVAVDASGYVLTSTNPTGGPSAWSKVRVHTSLFDVSCASTSLCVALGGDNTVWSTTEPANPSSWSGSGVPIAKLPDGLHDISCAPAASLCVASGFDNTETFTGFVTSSTSPTSGTWSAPEVISPHLLYSVTCASATLCIAGDLRGGLLWSTSPSLPSSWNRTQDGPGAPVSGLACASTSLCYGIDEGGHVLESTEPAGGAWTSTSVYSPSAIGSRMACASEGSVCMLGDSFGNLFVTGGSQEISGTITDPEGKPVDDMQVNVTGADSEGAAVSLQAKTDPTGHYSLAIEHPGTYTVAPQPPAGTITTGACPGTALTGACRIGLSSGEHVVADFTYTPGPSLSGVVASNSELRGTRLLTGVQIHITGHDNEGRSVDMTVATDHTGHYSAMVNPGTYEVAPTGSPPTQPEMTIATGHTPITAVTFFPLTPPADGEYAPISCTGTPGASSCTLVVAAESTSTANFAYGDRHVLHVSFAPERIRGDGFGQTTVTVSATDLRGKPASGVDLAGYVLPEPNARAVVCRLSEMIPAGSDGQAFISPHNHTTGGHNSLPEAFDETTDSGGVASALVFAGNTGGSVLSYREGAVGAIPLEDGLVSPELRFNPTPPSDALSLTQPVKAGFTTQGTPQHLEYLRSFTGPGLAQELHELMVKAGAPSGLLDAPPKSAAAVQTLLDWLVALKAAGYLPDLGFGPIDGVPGGGLGLAPPGPGGHAAILFYREDDTTLIQPADPILVAPDDSPGAQQHDVTHLVLDVVQANTLLSGEHYVGLPSLGRWLEAEKLGEAVAGLHSGTEREGENYFPITYFGWPYPPPPTIPGAARFYQCLGSALPQVEHLVVHSPVHLLISAGHGHSLGFAKGGRQMHTLPGMFVAAPPRTPAL